MTIDNQIEIPPSFIALYLTPGRDRPNVPQESYKESYNFATELPANRLVWRQGPVKGELLLYR